MRCINSGCIDYTETRNNYCGRYADVTECDEMEPRNLAKPNAQPALSDGWRDMQKEPPTTTDEIMFYSRTTHIMEIGRCINGKCYGRSGMYRDGQATAWRELPDPPAFA